MRSGSHHSFSFPLLLLLIIWLLAAATPTLSQFDAGAIADPIEKLTQSDPFTKFTRTLSRPKELKQAVKKAPETLRLGADDFLGSGLKRKSVAGAYGTSAAVAVGGAAISYQALNLHSKNRDAEIKKESESSFRTGPGPPPRESRAAIRSCVMSTVGVCADPKRKLFSIDRVWMRNRGRTDQIGNLSST